jgi:D-cysteine desulfhydrase family pyridoxal phosphate-dependent enzyme
MKGPTVFMKRDDLTGQAFGGNKSRKMEYIIQDALAKKADVLVTWASLQSNWCLQAAATASRFGLEAVLTLFKTYDLPEDPDGNLLLDLLLEADVRIREAPKGKVISLSEVGAYLDKVTQELRLKGRNPYVVSVGGSQVFGSMDKPLGAIAYVEALVELWEQAAALGVKVDGIVHATGSGGTQAGLAVGARALDPAMRVVGISVSDEKETFARTVLEVCGQTERALDLRLGLTREDIIVLDDYLQDGYGVVNKHVSDAVRTLFQKEGVVLDPVYTAKAWIGLRDLVRKGYFQPGENIIFFHTGGTPALFPFGRELLKNL